MIIEDAVTVEDFQDHCEKNTKEFLVLKDKLIENEKDNKVVHIEIKKVQTVLEGWTPFISQLQKEITRANAYKIVSDDLRSKGVSWKFWFGVVAVTLTVISGILFIIEKFGGSK